jgi:hypothetical protein
MVSCFGHKGSYFVLVTQMFLAKTNEKARNDSISAPCERLESLKMP